MQLVEYKFLASQTPEIESIIVVLILSEAALRRPQHENNTMNTNMNIYFLI